MLKQKILNAQSGILLYGLTPPKIEYGEDRIRQISQTQSLRIQNLGVDGIILYDIQDEASRMVEKRPFPYLHTVDATTYANEYLHVNVPKIIYKAVGKYSKDEFTSWLDDIRVEFSVFVGAASAKQEISLDINTAYKLKQEYKNDLIIGGIAIPERHAIKNDEHERVYKKIQNGCKFFITQATYNKEISKKFLDDYANYMQKMQTPCKPIIFTLTPCGTLKTLEFMKWLGISILDEKRLINAQNMLEQSALMCVENFTFLYEYAKKINVPVGCNIESVAVTKEEIGACVNLFADIKNILQK